MIMMPYCLIVCLLCALEGVNNIGPFIGKFVQMGVRNSKQIDEKNDR